MDRTRHKGYEIHATPNLLTDYGQWSIHGCITLDAGSHVDKMLFNGDAVQRFNTEEEAKRESIDYAKKLIDS